MQLIKKLLYLLSRKERKQAFLLFIMVLVMALLEMIGVASIMPFMAVLTNPEIIETNSLLNKAYTLSGSFGVETQQQFLFFFRYRCLCLASYISCIQDYDNFLSNKIYFDVSIQYCQTFSRRLFISAL